MFGIRVIALGELAYEAYQIEQLMKKISHRVYFICKDVLMRQLGCMC